MKTLFLSLVLFVGLALPVAAQQNAQPAAQQQPLPSLAPQQQQPQGGSISPLPNVSLVGQDEGYALPIQLLLTITVLAIAPSIIILTTSFTRLIVVFGLLRTALGMQGSPPNQVIIGLSLFLTIFIMYPVIDTVNKDALQPYLGGEITQQEAFDRAQKPMKGFMLAQTREKDLMLFMDLSRTPVFDTPDAVPFHVLVPAFVISELRIAFQIGFMLFLPFVVVDLLVSSTLMSMGMMMLPPIMISLPVKLLLFVLTDGWYLIVESVVKGYMMG